MKKALCIMSGGMDSTLCAYKAKKSGYEVIGLHFNYSQRTQNKEKECFYKICEILDAKTVEIDTNFIAQIGGNSLTDTNLEIRKTMSDDVPNTYVPFRNGIFLSIAAAVAERYECEAIYIGVTQADGSGYPDCTAEFIKAIEKAINLGRVYKSSIKTPLINLNKADIVKEALNLGVALKYTWSCYEGGDLACGECDSCRLRLKGFSEAGVEDEIPYAKLSGSISTSTPKML